MMDVTLVIPAKNAGPVLRQCLDAVAPIVGAQVRQIILVDDGSTDDTVAIAKSYGVHVVHSPQLGPGGARNLGWQAADSPLVWFIDSDCVAQPDALTLLLAHLTSDGVAGVGGSYGNMRPDSTLACLVHEEIIARHRRMSADVDYLATYNVVYRRDALEKVNGFDEGNFNGPGAPGAEDIELAFRLHDAGYRLRFEPRSIVGHYHPTRLSRYLRSQRLHGFFRVNLYLHHHGRAAGDAYSGLLDHLQPPLAMLILASLSLALFGWHWLAIPLVLSMALALMQIPVARRLIAQTGSWRYALYVPLGWLRAFARGIGMSLATLQFLVKGKQPMRLARK
jgi:glycosyltransferase involved in cell wall biosynthesis